MDFIPKELEENQLKVEICIDPDTKFLTMKTHIDDKSVPLDLIPSALPEDPLLQKKSEDPVDLVAADSASESSQLETEQVDFEKMSELEQLIYMERQRLLNLKLPKKTEKSDKEKVNSYDWDTYKTDSNHQLTQKEKSKLRMRKFREKESAEEREYRQFRNRVRTLKIRLLQKLQNFEDEAHLKDISKRAWDRRKQMRLTETPAQEALRKKRVNLAKRRSFLRNKVFSTPEDLMREKERRIKYLEKTRSHRSEEQRIAKRKQYAEKAREKRRQNNKEWEAIQKTVKGHNGGS